MARTIDMGSLGVEIQRVLTQYGTVEKEKVKKAVQETAEKTMEQLKATSPKGRRKKYSRSWKAKKRSENATSLYMSVQAGKEYPLTHLLEKGHALAGGGRSAGRTRAYPHIQDAQENADRILIQKLERLL